MGAAFVAYTAPDGLSDDAAGQQAANRVSGDHRSFSSRVHSGVEASRGGSVTAASTAFTISTNLALKLAASLE